METKQYEKDSSCMPQMQISVLGQAKSKWRWRMSEELLQRDLVKNPDKIGKWDFYNIGATNVRAYVNMESFAMLTTAKLEKRK